MFHAKSSSSIKSAAAIASAFCLVFQMQIQPVFSQTDADGNQKILHLLNRVTFGPRPGDVEDVERMGVEKFLQQQLHPETIPLPESLVSNLASNDAINSSPMDIAQRYFQKAKGRKNAKKTGKSISTEEKKAQSKERKQAYGNLYTEASDAKLRRAVESPRQLEEVMVEFWFNHFNVSNNKGRDHLWTGAYEQQAIRPYALGKFRDLVAATSHHPAMLFYLDNWQNSKPGTEDDANKKKGKGKFKGLNENYARELMELHTLGVDGGYSQKDVVELARILTGLGLPPQNPRLIGTVPSGRFGSTFNSNRHDYGDKNFLGTAIKGSGEGEIDQAIDLLCRAPATAHHISYQLAQYFVADEPPKPLVERLTATYERTDGDIAAILTQLFHSPEFWDSHYVKFKTPFRYIVSSLRAADIAPNDYKACLNSLRQQGMPLYGCLTPDGYKNTQEAWLSPSSLLRRIQFATGLGSGTLPSVQVEPVSPEQMTNSMKGMFDAKTLKLVASSPVGMRTSILLGSPEFMNH